MAKRKKLYEVLDVDESADPATLKRAYRKKARKHHPDKDGGNEAKMAEINRAWEILANPGTRLIYDQTGEEPSISSLEEKARNALLRVFTEILQNDIRSGCIQYAEGCLKQNLGDLEAAKRRQSAESMRLTARRERFRVKSGDNLFHLLIDQQLERIEALITKMTGDIRVFNRALEMLKGYESIDEAAAAMDVSMFEIRMIPPRFYRNGPTS